MKQGKKLRMGIKLQAGSAAGRREKYLNSIHRMSKRVKESAAVIFFGFVLSFSFSFFLFSIYWKPRLSLD